MVLIQQLCHQLGYDATMHQYTASGIQLRNDVNTIALHFATYKLVNNKQNRF